MADAGTVRSRPHHPPGVDPTDWLPDSWSPSAVIDFLTRPPLVTRASNAVRDTIAARSLEGMWSARRGPLPRAVPIAGVHPRDGHRRPHRSPKRRLPTTLNPTPMHRRLEALARRPACPARFSAMTYTVPAPLRQRPAYQALEQHFEHQEQHLKELFAADPTRGTSLTLEAEGIYLDYSKQRVTAETIGLLIGSGAGVGPGRPAGGHVRRRAHQHHRGPRGAARRAARAGRRGDRHRRRRRGARTCTRCSAGCAPSPTGSGRGSGRGTPESRSATSSTSASAAATSAR